MDSLKHSISSYDPSLNVENQTELTHHKSLPPRTTFIDKELPIRPQDINTIYDENDIPVQKTTMRAVVLKQFGQPLELQEIPIPKLRPGQLLIKLEAAPINPSDLGFLKGISSNNAEIPAQLGFEGSGTVVSSGGGLVARALVGKRVAFAATSQPGTWAEYAVTDTSSCFPLDKKVPFDIGACAIVNPFTALALVNVIKKEKHQAIVQTAAASPLGRMVIQLLKKEGVKTINLVKKDEHKKMLESLGADIVLNCGDLNFEEDLRRIISELNATCCVECVCSEITHKVLKTLPQKSICYVYGLHAIDNLDSFDLNDFLVNSKEIKAFNTLDWLHEQGFFKKLGLIRKVESMMKNTLQTDISKSFRLEQVNEAVEFCMADMTIGKVLLKPNFISDEEMF